MKHLTLVLFTIFLCWIQFSQSVQITAKYDDSAAQTVTFNLKGTLQLTCNVSENVKITWRKDGELVEFKDRVSEVVKDKISTLRITRSEENDAGNYTCSATSPADSMEVMASIKAASKIAVKVQSNINVVEGEKLRILCNVAGRPFPTLSWLYFNDTSNYTIQDLGERVKLVADEDRGIENAVLKIEEVAMFDRGVFRCIGKTEQTEVHSDSMVRIKDKYAALWPFLGICAEVFILCAIIFIYEKKRNKSELEESDTDQSPDQKNTPDHGKDSNLRHRQ